MKKDISISCVITLYNRQEYINDAIDCVLKQTLKPLEIIVVDNSSKEIKIDEKYLDKIKIFKIIPGAGLAQTLNFGASIVTGEYISFLEDDDHWPENYLEEVYKENDLETDYIVTPIKKLKNNKLTFYKNPKNKIKLNNFLIRNPGINISNLSVKKTSLFKVGGFDLDCQEVNDKELELQELYITIQKF